MINVNTSFLLNAYNELENDFDRLELDEEVLNLQSEKLKTLQYFYDLCIRSPHELQKNITLAKERICQFVAKNTLITSAFHRAHETAKSKFDSCLSLMTIKSQQPSTSTSALKILAITTAAATSGAIGDKLDKRLSDKLSVIVDKKKQQFTAAKEDIFEAKYKEFVSTTSEKIILETEADLNCLIREADEKVARAKREQRIASKALRLAVAANNNETIIFAAKQLKDAEIQLASATEEFRVKLLDYEIAERQKHALGTETLKAKDAVTSASKKFAKISRQLNIATKVAEKFKHPLLTTGLLAGAYFADKFTKAPIEASLEQPDKH